MYIKICQTIKKKCKTVIYSPFGRNDKKNEELSTPVVRSRNIQILQLTKPQKLKPAINEPSVSTYLSRLRMKTSLVRGDFGGIVKFLLIYEGCYCNKLQTEQWRVSSQTAVLFRQTNPKQKILRGQQREFEKQQGEISPKYRSQKGKGRLAE